jgi:hypothetical protein
MADLREIFRHTPFARNYYEDGQMIQQDNPYAVVNNSDMSDEDFYRANQIQGTTSSFDRGRQWNGQDFTTQWNIRKDSILDRVNNEYGAGAEVKDGRLNVDWSKLPKSPLGSVDRLMPTTDHERRNLKNPNLVYKDNNYGNVTRVENWKSNNEWMGPALMAAMSMGMGGLWGAVGAGMAGKTGMGLVNMGRSIGSGNFNPVSLAMNGLGMVPGMQGMMSGPAGNAARLAAGLIQRERGGKG